MWSKFRCKEKPATIGDGGERDRGDEFRSLAHGLLKSCGLPFLAGKAAFLGATESARRPFGRKG